MKPIIDEVLKSSNPAVRNLARIYENCSTSNTKRQCEKRLREYISNGETCVMSRDSLGLPKNFQL